MLEIILIYHPNSVHETFSIIKDLENRLMNNETVAYVGGNKYKIEDLMSHFNMLIENTNNTLYEIELQKKE